MTSEREREEQQAFVNEAIANIDAAIQEMVEKGMVRISYDAHGHQIITLTELGMLMDFPDPN